MGTEGPEGTGTADYKSALVASFLGWTLDAFDFFVLVFVLPNVAVFAQHTTYANAMALTALTVFVLGSVVVVLGPEKRGARFAA